jgi:hypothetical protein
VELGGVPGVLDEGDVTGPGFFEGAGGVNGEVAVALDGPLHELRQLP